MGPLLLVDGDRNFREALAIALRLDGIDVLTVGTVREAEDAMAAASCALVVVDALLAGAEDLISALAVASPERVVATGTYRELLDRAAARHRVRTLEKPFGAAELRGVTSAG